MKNPDRYADHCGDQLRFTTSGAGRDVPGGPMLSLARVYTGVAAVAGAAGGYSAVGGAFCAGVCPPVPAADDDVERRGAGALAGVCLAGECAGVGTLDSSGGDRVRVIR